MQRMLWWPHLIQNTQNFQSALKQFSHSAVSTKTICVGNVPRNVFQMLALWYNWSSWPPLSHTPQIPLWIELHWVLLGSCQKTSSWQLWLYIWHIKGEYAKSPGVTQAPHHMLLGALYVLLDGSIPLRLGHYWSSETSQKVQFNDLSISQMCSNSAWLTKHHPDLRIYFGSIKTFTDTLMYLYIKENIPSWARRAYRVRCVSVPPNWGWDKNKSRPIFKIKKIRQ